MLDVRRWAFDVWLFANNVEHRISNVQRRTRKNQLTRQRTFWYSWLVGGHMKAHGFSGIFWLSILIGAVAFHFASAATPLEQNAQMTPARLGQLTRLVAAAPSGARGRREFSRRMEAAREGANDPERLTSIRRGWKLGSEDFLD
jgi:hypothetical protein